MNASLQALRTIPELKTVLSTYRPSQTEARISSISNEGSHSGVTSDLRNLFVGMDKTTEAIPPFAFLNSLRRVNPQFAEQSQHGGYAQQGGQQN
jgi:ubiquitin carboxyl-terminal hydrolase 14